METHLPARIAARISFGARSTIERALGCWGAGRLSGRGLAVACMSAVVSVAATPPAAAKVVPVAAAWLEDADRPHAIAHAHGLWVSDGVAGADYQFVCGSVGAGGHAVFRTGEGGGDGAGRLVVASGDGAWVSTSGGCAWAETTGPVQQRPLPGAVTPTPGSGTVLFVVPEIVGPWRLVRSTDGGVTTGPYGDFVVAEVDVTGMAGRGDMLVVSGTRAAGSGGQPRLWVSTDGGLTVSPVPDGAWSEDARAPEACAAVPDLGLAVVWRGGVEVEVIDVTSGARLGATLEVARDAGVPAVGAALDDGTVAVATGRAGLWVRSPGDDAWSLLDAAETTAVVGLGDAVGALRPVDAGGDPLAVVWRQEGAGWASSLELAAIAPSAEPVYPSSCASRIPQRCAAEGGGLAVALGVDRGGRQGERAVEEPAPVDSGEGCQAGRRAPRGEAALALALALAALVRARSRDGSFRFPNWSRRAV